MALELRNRYTPAEDKCYIGFVKLLNLADARGVKLNVGDESDVFQAKAVARQTLLNDYAEKKRLTSESRRQQIIQEYKDAKQPVPYYLGERLYALEEFLDDARIELDFDLGLISNNPCDQNPCAEYYKFHEK